MTRYFIAFVLLLPAACVPEADAETAASARNGGDRPPPRPPKEAVDACAELATGDTCSFAHDTHEIVGTCFSPDEDKPLACKPDQPAPGEGS